MAAEIASDWGIESIGLEGEKGDSEVFTNGHTGKMEKETCNFLPETKNINQVKNMDDFVLSYFESMNSMARRIIAEEREVIKEHGQRWTKLSPDEQEKIIDDRLIKPEIRKVYGIEDEYDSDPKWFPVLKLSHGISDEAPSDPPRRTSIISVTDMHARDQFSAPWSWETESQQELNFVDQEELEVALKDAVESDAKLGEVVVPPFGFPTKSNFSGFESSESKEPSLSGSSGAGSSQMARKDYLDFDFDCKGTSQNSSMQGSKSSLISSQHSETTSPQNHIEDEASQTVARTEILTTAQEKKNPAHITTEREQPEEQMEREESEQRTDNVKPTEPKSDESAGGSDLMAFLTNW